MKVIYQFKIMNEQELEDWKACQYRMKEEGFHYCFKHYSNWDEIKDNEFHKLRNQYLESANKLEQYVNSKVK